MSVFAVLTLEPYLSNVVERTGTPPSTDEESNKEVPSFHRPTAPVTRVRFDVCDLLLMASAFQMQGKTRDPDGSSKKASVSLITLPYDELDCLYNSAHLQRIVSSRSVRADKSEDSENPPALRFTKCCAFARWSKSLSKPGEEPNKLPRHLLWLSNNRRSTWYRAKSEVWRCIERWHRYVPTERLHP